MQCCSRWTAEFAIFPFLAFRPTYLIACPSSPRGRTSCYRRNLGRVRWISWHRSSLASWTTTSGGVDPGDDLKRTQLRQPGITWVRAARDTGAGEATSRAHTTNADGFAALSDHTRHATPSIPTEEGFQDVSEDTDMRSLATYVACAFAAVASGCGLGWEQEVYRREPAAMVAQAVAQDAVTIGWVLPLTLVCTWATHRGSKAARMVRLGCLAYLTYSYVLACVLISRNELFLVYVAAYSTAALALWGELQRANASRCKKFFTTKGRWSASKSLQIAVAAYGLLTSMGAGMAWLMEEIAMLKGLTGSLLPQQSTTALPVQAFDLGFIIPLHVFGAVQLLRGKPVGFFIASVFLVLSSTLVVAIASMAFLMYKRSIVPHDDKAHIVLPCVASIGVLLTICWFHGAKEPKKKL